MPLLVAPFVAFALGTLLGFALGIPERATDARFGRVVATWFACLGFAPLFGYFAWSEPSWSLGYLMNGDRVPSAIFLAAVAGSAALVVAGFDVAQRFIAEGDNRTALTLGFGALLVSVVLIAALASRLWLVGSYAEVTGGFAVPTLASSSTGLAASGLIGLSAGSLWIALGALRSPGPVTKSTREPVLLRGRPTDAPTPQRITSVSRASKARSPEAHRRRR